MWIQVILLALFAYILLKVLAGSGNHTINAWKKLAISFLTVIMIISVLYPGLTNTVANVLGIGRGADLLLYVFFASFLAYVLMQYLRQQESVDKMNRLAREIAVTEARVKYGIGATGKVDSTGAKKNL